MTDSNTPQDENNASSENAEAEKPIPDAAKRALAEAQERREKEAAQSMPKEYGGRGGADPSRFGDWEIDGRAIDF